MRKYIGASLVVLGIILTAYGLDGAGSIKSQFSRLFTVWTPDAPMWLLIAGILSVMVGLSLSFHQRQRA